MAQQPQVVITSRIHDEVLRRLREHFLVVANPAVEPWPRDTWLRHLADADGLITFMSDHIDEDVLRQCPRLKVIACALKGCDNFDVAACQRRGIGITCAEELLTEAVAELTVGLLISVGRSVAAGDRLIRSGGFRGWRPHLYGTGLNGSTVGFIGMGGIGKATATRLRPFGSFMIYYDIRRLTADQEREFGVTFSTLERLQSSSDFIVLGVPLTPATLHIVNHEFLAAMKRGALLVNTARGSLVDEAAVAQALRMGQLGGYAADVFEFEDWLRPDRPAEISPELLRSDHAVFTPHLGSAVQRVRLAVEMQAAERIIAYFAANTAATNSGDEQAAGRC